MATFSDVVHGYPTLAKALKLIFADNSGGRREFRSIADYPLTLSDDVLRKAEAELKALDGEDFEEICIGEVDQVVDQAPVAAKVLADFFDGENNMFSPARVCTKHGMRIKGTPTQRQGALAAIQIKDPQAKLTKSRAPGCHVIVSALPVSGMEMILEQLGFKTGRSAVHS